MIGIFYDFQCFLILMQFIQILNIKIYKNYSFFDNIEKDQT